MDLRLGKPTALGILATSVIGHLRRFTAATISTAKVGTSPSTSLAATVLVLRAPLSGFASQPLCKVRHVEPLADDLFLDAIPKDGAPIVSARVGVLLKTTEQRQQRGVPAGGVLSDLTGLGSFPSLLSFRSTPRWPSNTKKDGAPSS
jgi:hypothetical protein